MGFVTLIVSLRPFLKKILDAATLDLFSEKEVDAVISGCTEGPKAEKSAKPLHLFTKKNCFFWVCSR